MCTGAERKVPAITLRREGEKWRMRPEYNPFDPGLVKRPGLTGPIDDCFRRDGFVVVTPSGNRDIRRFNSGWILSCNHFRHRWRALMRGDLPEMRDVDYDPENPPTGGLVILGATSIPIKRWPKWPSSYR